ncbi:hypothetical protein UlMin_014909 [Ulmus minor]
MVLPLTQPPPFLFPPKHLADESLSFFLSFPFSKTLTSQYRKPLKFLVRSSGAGADAQTLPKSAIQRIAEKLRSLGFDDDNRNSDPEPARRTSAGEIFVPLPNQLPKPRVGHTIDSSWSSPENPVPEPGSGTAITRFHELRGEVKKQKQEEKKELAGKKLGRAPTLAELTLAPGELRRLRTLGIELRKKLKVGKAGITEGIVNGIHERWRRHEVVKIVCEDLSKMNMKRTHDLLERKTGGLVVWRSGSKIILYRGKNYKYPYFLRDKTSNEDSSSPALVDTEDKRHNETDTCSSSIDGVTSRAPVLTKEKTKPTLIQGVGLQNRVRFQLPGEAQLAEEADRLLEGLGPRFTDWWGYEPLPVDADLLPAVVKGYRRPFRLLPYGVQPKLTNDEMTTLRRLGRPLLCHFALGRNRNLQGLASSIVKLWEKCEIAKIAVKRGVQNTNSEIMAEELKNLTGGTLLARDREFIVLYRGKDFLPHAVSSAIEERRKHGIHAEKPTTEQSSSVTAARDGYRTVESGPLDEQSKTNNHQRGVLSKLGKPSFMEASIKRTSIKLSMALEKRAKAEKLLAELEKSDIRQDPEVDKEGITEEERYMLRKIGLRMKPFLLMGRRGVFDGTIENMHLHWKYRELVKIICNEKSIEAVHHVARILETESGGILVAVERVSKGYAVIVYRGKNYERPATLRPQTLLNKRQAMKRSIEAQRRQSLKLHVLRLTKNIDDLKIQMIKDKETNRVQSIDESSKLVTDKMNGIQSTQSLKLDAEINSGSLSHPVTSHEEIITARVKHGAHSTPVTMNDGINTSIDSLYETGEIETGRSYESRSNDTHTNSSENINFDAKAVVSKMHPDKSMVHVPDNEARESSGVSERNGPETSVPITVGNALNKMPSRALRLSNKERLLLRRQALGMKKRPVLAVGRSNIVTGLAKTIKAHFQKYPLAIVNVKGRAKGTSVQEVVFQLEQATGAVLVSQEPSKVILYRGWGAGDNYNSRNKNTIEPGKPLETKPAVSPELLEAIRTECGLQPKQKENTTP